MEQLATTCINNHICYTLTLGNNTGTWQTIRSFAILEPMQTIGANSLHLPPPQFGPPEEGPTVEQGVVPSLFWNPNHQDHGCCCGYPMSKAQMCGGWNLSPANSMGRWVPNYHHQKPILVPKAISPCPASQWLGPLKPNHKQTDRTDLNVLSPSPI